LSSPFKIIKFPAYGSLSGVVFSSIIFIERTFLLNTVVGDPVVDLGKRLMEQMVQNIAN
jgi:hypothetical protein